MATLRLHVFSSETAYDQLKKICSVYSPSLGGSAKLLNIQNTATKTFKCRNPPPLEIYIKSDEASMYDQAYK